MCTVLCVKQLVLLLFLAGLLHVSLCTKHSSAQSHFFLCAEVAVAAGVALAATVGLRCVEEARHAQADIVHILLGKPGQRKVFRPRRVHLLGRFCLHSFSHRAGQEARFAKRTTTPARLLISSNCCNTTCKRGMHSEHETKLLQHQPNQSIKSPFSTCCLVDDRNLSCWFGSWWR